MPAVKRETEFLIVYELGTEVLPRHLTVLRTGRIFAGLPLWPRFWDTNLVLECT